MKQIQATSDIQLKAMREVEFKQAHSLTEARMVTTPCEFDLLSMILANYNETETVYKIHIKDIEYITGRQWNHSQLYSATEKMGSHMFKLDLPDRMSQIWLFSSVDYLKGTGTIEIDINRKAMPLLSNIKENGFTSVQLKSTLSLTSLYAKRIYGLCCKWANLGYKEFEIDELKRILNVVDDKGNDSYPLSADFKKEF